MPKYFNINGWPSEMSDVVTIGKRIKKVVYHPQTYEEYYFKEPKEEYPWEFWTEVIASAVGRALGFDVLKYSVAISGDRAGCLSKSMISHDETLIHGQQYLTAIKPDFEIDRGLDHNFQLIEEFLLSRPSYQNMIPKFIDMLIFDSIIGNRDRHQQNWALIRPNNLEIQGKITYSQFIKLSKPIRFSPLFDNGNCLAYEILENKIVSFLENESRFEKYLFGNKATSHVRWEGNLKTHNDLIINIANKYNPIVKEIMERVKICRSKINIRLLVNNIDNGIIFADPKYSLSQNRKDFIALLIDKRLDKLLI